MSYYETSENKACFRLISSSLVIFFLLSVLALPNVYADDLINRNTRELDFAYLAKMQIVVDQYKFNLGNYIPLRGLPANDDGDEIAERIFRFSLQNMLDDYKARGSPAANSVSEINEGMKSEVGTNSHRILFRFRPIEAIAKATYSGDWLINMSLAYDFDRQQSRFEISKEFGSKTVQLNRVSENSETIQYVSIQWTY